MRRGEGEEGKRRGPGAKRPKKGPKGHITTLAGLYREEAGEAV